MEDFIEEMLREAEVQERKLEHAQVDAILMEIARLQSEIENNFKQSEEEKKIIDDWAISRNSKIQERSEWLAKKLEVFMTEQGNVKKIDLPHGQLLRRKQVQKIEITDLTLFMTNKNLGELTSTQPESIVPCKNKIKAFYRMTLKLPAGVTIVEGGEKFSIKLKQFGGINGKTETGTGITEADDSDALV